MRAITLVLPYYMNGTMLREQQRVWRAYPEKRKPYFHAIVVDDGSPANPAADFVEPDTGIASFQLYRCLEDVRWNWLFCRNLGMQKAKTDWVLLTDIDHVVPESTLRWMQEKDLDRDNVYRFSRVDAPNLTPYKPHPNTWFMTRRMFDAIGGYDERFSGYYGTDGEFRDRVRQSAKQVVMLSEVMVRYPREVIPDASTTRYGRKEPQDHVNVARIRQEREAIANWRPLRVTFPYERVA